MKKIKELNKWELHRYAERRFEEIVEEELGGNTYASEDGGSPFVYEDEAGTLRKVWARARRGLYTANSLVYVDQIKSSDYLAFFLFHEGEEIVYMIPVSVWDEPKSPFHFSSSHGHKTIGVSMRPSNMDKMDRFIW